MPFASIGAAIWDVLKRIPGWVFFALGALVLGKIYLENEKAKAVTRANDKRDKQAAEVESQIIATITENSNAMVRESDAVRSRSATVVMPDGSKDLPSYHYRDR